MIPARRLGWVLLGNRLLRHFSRYVAESNVVAIDCNRRLGLANGTQMGGTGIDVIDR